jgi:long-chain fatty acid transport protein
MRKLRWCLLVFVFLFDFSGLNLLFALGGAALGNQAGISTRIMSLGYSFSGVSDDASAIFFNPGGLTQVKGLNLMTGASVLNLATEHTSTAGTNDEMESNTPFVPYFYSSYSNPNSRWAYGLGINSPFGLITEWKDDSFSKYYATKSQLLMYVINPTIAYSFTDSLSFGAGIDYFNVYDTELNARVFNVDSLLIPGSPTGDGNSKLSGDGTAWGYNFGAHWRANDKHSFGLSYRSQVNVPVEGTVELSNLQDGTAFAFNGLSLGSTYKSDVTTEFKFPQSVLFGYGFKPSEKMTLYADYEWVNWAIVEETKFNFSNNNANLTQSINRDWKNSNNVGIGLEYKANQRVDLRVGGFLYERVIPSSTLEASLPESGRFGLTTGVGLHFGNASIDLGYNAIFFNDRDVDNNQGNVFGSLDGKYETFINVFSTGVSYKWGAN